MDVFGKNTVSNGYFDKVNATEKELDLYNLLEGDVLFIRSSVKRSGVGEAVLVSENVNQTVYSGFLIRFRDKHKILCSDYKKYCFADQAFRKKLLSFASLVLNPHDFEGDKLSY